MTKIKKFICISFLFLSQMIISQPSLSEIISSQNYSKKLSQPICSEYKLSGSLEEANVLGMLITLGATTIGTFSCAFYVGYEGKYPDDCDELRCRVNNQQAIINNAKHVINISNNYLNSQSSSTSLKRKVQQGLVKINKTMSEWQKVTPSTPINRGNVKFIEQNLNTPLENLIIKQFSILPTQFKKDYFIKEAEKERRRIVAEMEKQRIAAEKERKRLAAEKERKRIEAEKERKRIEAERKRKRAELKRLMLIILPVLILLIIITNIRKRKKIAAEKEKERKETEKQKIKAQKNKEKFIEELNKQINNYQKKYSDKLSNYQNEFQEITKKIDAEEKELIDLKSRHPKIEMIVSSRKIGDSNQKTITEIKKLLNKLK